MKPSPRLTEPMSTGTITPKRSESRPISTPPSPNPIMVNVKGSEASPRAIPNSACSGGNATAMEYIPDPPIVIKASAAQRRVQAYGESAPCDVWRVLIPGAPGESEQDVEPDHATADRRRRVQLHQRLRHCVERELEEAHGEENRERER